MSDRPHLFGTDGMRGTPGEHPLDRRTVTLLGERLAETLGAGARVVMGGDTRDSTPRLAAWLAAGLATGGAEAEYLGVVPTPAVAFLVRDEGAAAGIAVSASHNPWPDNGIKLFDAAGAKWAPAAEAALERRLEEPGAEIAEAGDEPPPVARRPRDRYLASLAASLDGERPLADLRVALDTAHGATTEWAAAAFAIAGAASQQIGDSPDGRNINQAVGSTHPEALAELVSGGGFDLGVAFDGDGDRAILVDEAGRVRDGDEILYLLALDLRQRRELDPPAIVATSMSNLGLEKALAENGIEVVRCDVGDREVVATMRRRGIVLGGEQSGHVVLSRLATTGDGMLTALQIAGVVARSGRAVSELLAGYRRYPQLLRNVRVARKTPFAELPGVERAAREATTALDGRGRLVLRYSGTESLARIMLEGPEQTELERLAERIEAALVDEVGA